MKSIKITLTGFLFAIFSYNVTAQQSVTAAGNNAIGTGGSSSYSVGQVVYTVNTGTTGNLIQGVQQPFEISTLGTNEYLGINLEFSVYPNPTNNFLTLSIQNYDFTNLKFQLFDSNGKLIENNKVSDVYTQIEMNPYEAGIYFLEVTENSKKIKTFKIIKK